MNAVLMMTVRLANIAREMNAKILALRLYVATMQNVKQNLTELFAFAPLECKAILWYPVQRLAVLLTLIVQQQKSATTYHPAQNENANHFVEIVHVLRVRSAVLVITKKYVHVNTLYKEMDMFPAQNCLKLKSLNVG